MGTCIVIETKLLALFSVENMVRFGLISAYDNTNMDSVVVSKYHGRSKKTTQQLTSMLNVHDRLQKQIKEGNIPENKKFAEMWIPKAYRKPIAKMMFINCKINGITIRALVDSGCNKTTISMEAARRCGLAGFIDRRFKRNSIGVGSMTDMGSIHFMLAKFGNLKLPLSIDVEEGFTLDMLLGLDFMQFHRVIISMEEKGLEFFSKDGTGVVPFNQKLLYRQTPLITLGRTARYVHNNIAQFKTAASFAPWKNFKKISESSNELPQSWNDKGWKSIIKAQIKHHNIPENAKLGMKYIPEKFRKPVPMLAIRAKINGVPIKAVVDSGCNSTVMSQNVAERCGISKLIDLEGCGKAKGSGVGTSTVNGVIHFALIETENIALPCTIAVLEDLPAELLLGLDILLHHMISIDLISKSLVIGSTGIRVACANFVENFHDGVMEFLSIQ